MFISAYQKLSYYVAISKALKEKNVENLELARYVKFCLYSQFP